MLDMYKKAGFPEIPDFFGAAFTPVSSPGLNTPWYCVFGNHDDSVSGTVPSGIPPLEAMYTGSLKFEVARFSGAGQADRRRHQVRSQCDTRNPVRLHDAAAPGHPRPVARAVHTATVHRRTS